MRSAGIDCTREVVTERRRAIAAMTRQGRTAHEISTALGITKRSVERARHEMGITRPRPNPITPDEIERVAQLLQDGASLKEAAETIGRRRESMRRHFPNQSWTRQQVVEWASVTRRWKKAWQ